MKNNKKNRTLNIALMIIIGAVFLFVNKAVCLAASAKVTLSAKETTFEKGETFTVDVKVNSKESIGDFEGYLTYDTDILEFVSEATFIAGGEGLIKISDINVPNGELTKKYVVKFQAKDTGSSVIAFRETPSVYDFNTGQTMSVSSNQLKVEVGTKALASNNGDLKELKVAPGKLAPDFDPQTTEYSVDVESDVDQMIISSIPSDEKASVSMEGNKELEAGENTIVITVKAESGAEKVYKLLVIKKKADNEEESEGSEDLHNNEEGSDEYTNKDNVAILSKPEIIKENGELYYQNGFRYEILTPGTEVSIPKGYTKTTIIIDNTSIDVYSLEGNPDNEFLLIYAKGPSDSEGFYQYDRKEKTLQRYQKAIVTQQEENGNTSKEIKELESKLVIMGVLLIVLIAICTILILNLAQSNEYNKKRKKK